MSRRLVGSILSGEGDVSKLRDLRDELEARTETADVLVATCRGWQERCEIASRNASDALNRALQAEKKLAATIEGAEAATLLSRQWEAKARNNWDRAEAALLQLARMEMAYDSARRNMEEWRTLCNQQMGRALRAEAALAEHDKPCVCGTMHHGMILHGNRYCPNCGHPVEVK